MRPALRIGLVAAGYVCAFLIASAAVAIRVANTNGPDALASSGMYAFGDSFLFIMVFGLLALVPTGAALYFLRAYAGLWVALSAVGLSLALTGVAAVFLFAIGRHAIAPSPLATWGALSVLRILLAPVLAPAFLIAGLLSPHRSPRFALLAATVIEVVVSAYGAVVWFVPLIAASNAFAVVGVQCDHESDEGSTGKERVAHWAPSGSHDGEDSRVGCDPPGLGAHA